MKAAEPATAQSRVARPRAPAARLVTGPANPGLATTLASLHGTLGNAALAGLMQALADPSTPDAVRREIGRGGRPLDAPVQTAMQHLLGANFRDVQVHTDAEAGASARAVGAQAYAFGNDVVFAHSRFQPSTQMGRVLLAHELSHVMQQRIGGARPMLSSTAPHEKEARGVAVAVGMNSQAPVKSRSGIGLARSEPSDDDDLRRPGNLPFADPEAIARQQKFPISAPGLVNPLDDFYAKLRRSVQPVTSKAGEALVESAGSSPSPGLKERALDYLHQVLFKPAAAHGNEKLDTEAAKGFGKRMVEVGAEVTLSLAEDVVAPPQEKMVRTISHAANLVSRIREGYSRGGARGAVETANLALNPVAQAGDAFFKADDSAQEALSAAKRGSPSEAIQAAQQSGVHLADMVLGMFQTIMLARGAAGGIRAIAGKPRGAAPIASPTIEAEVAPSEVLPTKGRALPPPPVAETVPAQTQTAEVGTPGTIAAETTPVPSKAQEVPAARSEPTTGEKVLATEKGQGAEPAPDPSEAKTAEPAEPKAESNAAEPEALPAQEKPSTRFNPENRPPLSRGQSAPRSPVRTFFEPLRKGLREREANVLQVKNRTAAGTPYADLVAQDMDAQDLQEKFGGEGRRYDYGNRHEATLEGGESFGTHKLDQFWTDMVRNGEVIVTTPEVSEAAIDQLARLGAQYKSQYGKQPLIIIRTTKVPPPTR